MHIIYSDVGGIEKLKIANLINKYRTFSIHIKATMWFVICSMLQKGISFIVVPIFTRILSPEEYGIYSLYLSVLQILTIITSLYLYYGVFTNGMNKFDKDRDRYVSSMQGLTLTITFFIFIFFIFTQEMWSDFFGLAANLIFLMFIEMAFTPAMNFWSGRQRFEYRYKKLVLITLCKSFFNPFLGLLLIFVSTDKAFARIVSVVIIEVIFCGIIMIYQFKEGKCWCDLKYWKYALKMAIPLLPHYLSGMILNKGDQIMISKMVGNSEVAFYSVAYNIGMLIQIFTNSITNSFTPWIYQKIKSNNIDDIAQSIDILLLIVSCISISLMIFSPELVWIFGSSGYDSAVYVIPPVAASVFFIFLYNILAIPQFYFEKTKFLMCSSVIAAILNIVLNFIFINLFGYIAAGYTTLVCYILYSIGHCIISAKVMKNYMPGQNLYNYKTIIILSILMIIVGITCNLIFSYTFLRYVLLILFCIVIYIKREGVIELFSFIKNK